MKRLPVRMAMLLLGIALCGCSGPQAAEEVATAPGNSASDAGHGHVAGAQQVPEAPLQLLSVDAKGTVGTLDLISGETSSIGKIPAPVNGSDDGRYVFAAAVRGTAIIDSGVWSWDHEDHFHYYRAAPRILDTFDSAGPVRVSGAALSTSGYTGLYYPDDGQGVLLDNAELAGGQLVEVLRVDAGKRRGTIVPLGDGALVSDPDPGSGHGKLVYHGLDGHRVEQTELACSNPGAGTATPVGTVIGCAEGALLVHMEGGQVASRYFDYPKEANLGSGPAEFAGRKGRPVLALRDAENGAWALNLRTGDWSQHFAGKKLLEVSAVSDTDGHVVALSTEGRVLVESTGDTTAHYATKPLPGVASGELTTDNQRAYVSAAKLGVVYEIDFADGARLARTLRTPSNPDLMAEVGR